MKITEYERGHQDATREIIAWLHAEALRMNYPHARGILNGAAKGIGAIYATKAAKARVAQRARHNDEIPLEDITPRTGAKS